MSAVFSTAPVNVLAKLVRGTSALTASRGFRYRPMIFINLRLKGRGLLPDVVTVDARGAFPFFRLTEATLSMPWLAPPDKPSLRSTLAARSGIATGPCRMTSSAELALDALEMIVPGVRGRYLGVGSFAPPSPTRSS